MTSFSEGSPVRAWRSTEATKGPLYGARGYLYFLEMNGLARDPETLAEFTKSLSHVPHSNGVHPEEGTSTQNS